MKVFYSIINKGTVLILLSLLLLWPLAEHGADSSIIADNFEALVFQSKLAQKHLRMKRINSSLIEIDGFKGPLRVLLEGNLFSRKFLKALEGRGDPAYLGPIQESLELVYFQEKYRFLFEEADKSGDFTRRMALSLSAWNAPRGGKILTKLIDNKQKMLDVGCDKQRFIFNALWRLGAIESVDVMLKGFRHDICGGDQVQLMLSLLHTWPIKASQKKTIIDHCIRYAFTVRLNDSGQQRQACMGYLGRVGADSREVRENIRGFAAKDNLVAVRALGELGDRGFRSYLEKDLRSDIDESRNYPPLNHSTATRVVALLGMDSAYARKVLGAWVKFAPKKGTPEYKNLNQLFVEGSLLSNRGRKKLLPLVKPAFTKLEELARTNSRYQAAALRAAVGLVQMGDDSGLDLLLRSIQGRNQRLRLIALRGMGGGHGFGELEAGPGGPELGRGGLSGMQGESILKAIRGKLKYMRQSRETKAAMHSILHIQGLLNARRLSGLVDRRPTKLNPRKHRPRGSAKLVRKDYNLVAPDFQVTGKDMVHDRSNNRTWMRCAHGQSFQAGVCTGKALYLDFKEAGAHCQGVTLGGKSWRLPTLNELRTILKGAKKEDLVRREMFPLEKAESFWSSLAYGRGDMAVYAVSFYDWTEFPFYIENKAGIRCVAGD